MLLFQNYDYLCSLDYLLVKGKTSKVVMNLDCKEVSSGGVVNGYVAPDVVLVHFTQRGVLCQSMGALMRILKMVELLKFNKGRKI